MLVTAFPAPHLTSWRFSHKYPHMNILEQWLRLTNQKESPAWVTFMQMIAPHNTFTFVFPTPLLPPPKKGEKKTYSILLLLNYMTSSRPGTKSRGETCILKRSFAQNSFIMHIYANDILDYSRKSQSLLLLLPFGQSFCLAICMESGQWAKSLIGFTQKLSKRGNGGFIVLLWHSSKLKMREWWILQSLANIIYIPVSMLMNFGCLRLRLTALSRLSPSSSFIPLYLIFSTLNIK